MSDTPRTWNDGWRCAECCNGDRCDDPTHYTRENCPHCKGTGLAVWNIYAKEKEAKALRAELEQANKRIGEMTLHVTDADELLNQEKAQTQISLNKWNEEVHELDAKLEQERKAKKEWQHKAATAAVAWHKCIHRCEAAEAREAALREDAEFIDLLEVYMVDGEPRFAVHGYPGGPEYFMTARSAIDSARAAKEPE